MRKPKMSNQYDEESYVKGFKKGWGDCLGKVLGFLKKYGASYEEFSGWTHDELKEYVLSKHPYHSSPTTAIKEGEE